MVIPFPDDGACISIGMLELKRFFRLEVTNPPDVETWYSILFSNSR